jgi:ABC-type transport system substrate-binding protein
MILKEMTPASRVTFDKNPDYWEQPVLLDGFEFRIVPDGAPRPDSGPASLTTPTPSLTS